MFCRLGAILTASTVLLASAILTPEVRAEAQRSSGPLDGHSTGGNLAKGSYPGRELDYVADKLDRYGFMTISGVTLIQPDPNFQFDLDLTAREIFDRNRVEGFSNVSQEEAMDLQVSVLAEVQALSNALSQSNSPARTQELQQKLTNAAAKGLVSILLPNHPELAKLLDDAQQSAQTDAADSDAATKNASDAGRGALDEARTALADSVANVAKSKDLFNQADGADEKKEKMELAIDAAAAAVTDLVTVADKGHEAAMGARDVAIQVQAAVSRMPADEKNNTLPKEALAKSQEAITAADAAMEACRTLAGKVPELEKKVTAESTNLAAEGANMESIKTNVQTILNQIEDGADPLNLKGALDSIQQAVDAASLAASAAGVTIAPVQHKMLQASFIDQSKLKARTRLGQRRPVQSNYPGELSLNLRQLLNLTASDQMTQNMLKWLSYPQSYGPNKRVYLCMGTVNCTPGRYTYRGYQGTVELYFEYARTRNACGVAADMANERHRNMENDLAHEANKRAYDPTSPDYGKATDDFDKAVVAVKNAENAARSARLPEKVGTSSSPLAMAVFPMIDTQVLDLRTSIRQAYTFALQLIINGYPAAGNAVLDYAKQHQQDVETITGINTVTSFADGPGVGFTFSPRLVAQQDPSRINTKPGMNMQPQSFPAVFLITCDEDDIYSEDNQDGADTIICRQTYRWSRAPRPDLDCTPIWGRFFQRARYPRLTERQIGEMANSIDCARSALVKMREKDPLYCKDAPPGGTSAGTLEKRTRFLKAQALGQDFFLGLPLLDRPKTKQDKNSATDGQIGSLTVYPKKGWLNRPTSFTAVTDGAFTKEVQATLGGRRVNVLRTTKNTLQIDTPAWFLSNDPGENSLADTKALKVQLVVQDAKTVYVASGIEFSYYDPTRASQKPSGYAGLSASLNKPECLSQQSAPFHISITLSEKVRDVNAKITLNCEGTAEKAELKANAKGKEVTSEPLTCVLKDKTLACTPRSLGALVSEAEKLDKPLTLTLTLEFPGKTVEICPVEGEIRVK